MDLNIYFNTNCAKAKLLRKAICVIIKSHYQISRKNLLKHNSNLLIFEEELCYNKYRRRSRHLYLLCKYREIHAARREFEYLFQRRLRKSEAFEESNRRYNKIRLINSQGRFYWNTILFCYFSRKNYVIINIGGVAAVCICFANTEKFTP